MLNVFGGGLGLGELVVSDRFKARRIGLGGCTDCSAEEEPTEVKPSTYHKGTAISGMGMLLPLCWIIVEESRALKPMDTWSTSNEHKVLGNLISGNIGTP